MNKTVQQLVHDRLSDLGAIAPPSSQPISIRLDPSDIAKIDVLSRFLGYGNRSQLLRELIEASVEDLEIETQRALKDDPQSLNYYSDAMKKALGEVLSDDR